MPAFTLATYVHLLQNDLCEPLVLGTELAGAIPGATSSAELGKTSYGGCR